MDSFVISLTILVIIALLARWPVLRHVAMWRARRSGILEDVDLGLARVRLPSGWRPARFLNDGASLQAIHPVMGRYLIVISESLADFVDDLDVAEYSARTIGTLTGGFRVLACSDAEERRVGAFSARQVELEAICDGTLITYLHSTIKGTRAVHQVIGWATRSKYSRPVFDSLVDGFVELPGPPPESFRDATAPQEEPTPPPRGSGGHIGF